MKRRVLIGVALGVPLAVVTAAAILLALAYAAPVRVPDYVIRIALPARGALIGLPTVDGPADSSRPLVVLDAGDGGNAAGHQDHVASGMLQFPRRTNTLIITDVSR